MIEFAPVLVVCVVAIVFGAIYYRARRAAPTAGRGDVVFDEPCSVVVPMRFGFQAGSNGSFSRVKLFPGELIVAGAVSLTIPLAEIDSIGIARRWFSEGVRVVWGAEPQQAYIYVRHSKRLIAEVQTAIAASARSK